MIQKGADKTLSEEQRQDKFIGCNIRRLGRD